MSVAPRQPERVLFWLVSVGILVALVAWARPPADTFLWKALFDAGHAVVSGYLALVFWRLIVAWNGHARASGRDYFLAFVLTLASGLAIEIVQIFLPRDADLGDLLRNFLGTLAFLLAAWACERDPGGPFRRGWLPRTTVLTTSALLLMLAFVPVGRIASSYAQRDTAFPRLCDFDSDWEDPFIRLVEARLERIPRPDAWEHGAGSPGRRKPAVAGADKVARVTFQQATYPGFTIKEPFPDWRAYRDLVFEVFSKLPGPVELVLRIDDAHHNQLYSDRFNRTLTVVPGANVFRIPLAEVRSAPQSREMDMRHIAKVVVFAVEPPAPFSLDLDAFRLE